MPQVEFNNENSPSALYSKFQSSAQPPGIVQWMVSKGIAKTYETANMILLAITIIFVLVAVYLIYISSVAKNSNLTPLKLQQMQKMQQDLKNSSI
jgi:hypothetical protein